MNVWYLSDLHLEYRDYKLALGDLCPPGAQVLVLAGDIGNGIEAVEWMNRQQTEIGIPIVFVPGNHDFFDYERTDLFALLVEMQAIAAPRVHILYNESLELDGVMFLGTTLWTDYHYSDQPDRYSQLDLMRAAAMFPDYDAIYRGDSKFTPQDCAELHEEARDWLETELLTLRDQGCDRRVVATHYLPSPRSLDPRFLGQDTNAAFCSDLPDAFLGLAKVWLHGHTHYAQMWTGAQRRAGSLQPDGVSGRRCSARLRSEPVYNGLKGVARTWTRAFGRRSQGSPVDTQARGCLRTVKSGPGRRR